MVKVREFEDAVNTGNIPAGQYAALYRDGRYAATEADALIAEARTHNTDAAVLAWRLKEKGSILTRSLVLGYIPSRLDRAIRYAIGGLGAAIGMAPGPAAQEEEPE